MTDLLITAIFKVVGFNFVKRLENEPVNPGEKGFE